MVAKGVFADSVNIFISSGDGLRLRSSTEESGGIIPSDNGILRLCFEERKPFISSDMNERKLEAGYLKKDKISSLVVVPVLDDTFPLGVIAADSARFHAFSSADSDTLQMFSKEIVKILQRERVYPQIQRSYATLKILNEESSKLLSSLNLNVLVQSLIDGVYRIAPSNVVFFTAKGRDVEILLGKGLFPREKKIFGMKGTLLDMAVKNKGPMYISDVRNYRSPIMPFKTENVNAVFVLPMFYERDLLGILTLLLENKNALSPYQTDLLAVLGNQASTSMANAKFHAEIERLAVTDGLTGLFNHRHFGEARTGIQQASIVHPVVTPIDIDYFKKINDTTGIRWETSADKGSACKKTQEISTSLQDTAVRVRGPFGNR
jgi:transcriptional regulator with GAF, ATPase, and Fis domain